jgi:hypothetical protein
MSAAATTAQTPRVRARRGRPGNRTIAALALLAATALALGLLSGRESAPTARAHSRFALFTSGDRSFSIRYPAGWRATPLGATAAVIERRDRRGVVLMRERPPLRGTLSGLLRDLPRMLARRFPDFRPAGASVARLSTGPAVVYTFFRTKSHKVQSIVVAPAPAAHRSFTLEVVAPANARGAAREAGRIVRSLSVR